MNHSPEAAALLAAYEIEMTQLTGYKLMIEAIEGAMKTVSGRVKETMELHLENVLAEEVSEVEATVEAIEAKLAELGIDPTDD